MEDFNLDEIEPYVSPEVEFEERVVSYVDQMTLNDYLDLKQEFDIGIKRDKFYEMVLDRWEEVYSDD